ncbi:MAG: hypothetical protein E7488_08595 [Ruminococcaceae bacterium]|nr:hypothetical protein [Oscillospiraceae bacterium]
MAKNLLYFMLGNVEMAKISTQQLIEITHDSDFRDMLFDDLSEYEKFYNRILQLKTSGDRLKNVSPLAAVCIRAAINAKTARDKSPRRMSEMLINGFVRGIRDIEEKIVKAVKCNERREVIVLAKDYRRHLVANIERYRKI